MISSSKWSSGRMEAHARLRPSRYGGASRNSQYSPTSQPKPYVNRDLTIEGGISAVKAKMSGSVEIYRGALKLTPMNQTAGAGHCACPYRGRPERGQPQWVAPTARPIGSFSMRRTIRKHWKQWRLMPTHIQEHRGRGSFTAISYVETRSAWS